MVTAFNTDENVQILLFNTKLGSQSLNLHIGGHIIVGMEVPVNLPTWFQVIGRVFRIGQKFSPLVYLLWTDHTYDQVALHKITRKCVSAIAGEGSQANEGKAAREQAEELLVSFMGFQHSPYPAAWASTNYEKKDKYIRQLLATEQDDVNDEEEIPSTLEFVGQGMATPRKAASTNVARESKSSIIVLEDPQESC